MSGETFHRAQVLRQRLTPTEARLWGGLKRLRADGYHFRRQAPFRGYILDFVCYGGRLVVEVDGASHEGEDQARHDRVRDAVLRGQGFRTLRFWNHEVYDLEGVMARVLEALQSSPSPEVGRDGGAERSQSGSVEVAHRQRGEASTPPPVRRCAPATLPTSGEGEG